MVFYALIGFPFKSESLEFGKYFVCKGYDTMQEPTILWFGVIKEWEG